MPTNKKGPAATDDRDPEKHKRDESKSSTDSGESSVPTMRRPLPPGYSPLDRGPRGTTPFTQVANAVFRDPRLSAKAMGVFGHLSTHQDGYGVCPESIARHMQDGIGAIKGALRELEACGYLARTRARRPDGTLGPARWRITDCPEGSEVCAA